MAIGSLGSLSVSLETNMVRFMADMGRAASATEAAMARVNRAVGAATKVLGALGLAVGTVNLVGMIRDTIKATAALDDLAETTGVSVEALSRWQRVARITEGDFDKLTKGAAKLTTSMLAADVATSEQAQSFAALGIKVRTASGALRSTEEVLEDIAAKFFKTYDGANKTAIAIALFGRSGAELIPFLKEIAERSSEVGDVTKEQAAAAELLANQWRTLSADASSLGTSIANFLVPPLAAVFRYFQFIGKAQSLGIGTFRSLFTALDAMGSTFEDVTKLEAKIGDLRASIKKLEDEEKTKEGVTQGAGNQLKIASLTQEIEKLEKILSLTRFIAAAGLTGLENEDRKGILPNISRGATDEQAKKAIKQLREQVALEETKLRTLNDEKYTREQILLTMEFGFKIADAERAGDKATLNLLLHQLRIRQLLLVAAEKAENDADAKKRLEAETAIQKSLDDQQKIRDDMVRAIEEETNLNYERIRVIAQDEDAQQRALIIARHRIEEAKALREHGERAAAAVRERLVSELELLDAQIAQRKVGEQISRQQQQLAQIAADYAARMEQIGTSLTDALLRAFESGKGFAAAFRDTLANMFRTLVLRPVIQAILAPAVGLFAGNAQAGGIAGLGGLNNFLGGGLGGGLYNSFAMSSVGQGLGLSAFGMDTAGGLALTGAGMGIGAAIPLIGMALAAAAAFGAFDDEPSPVRGRLQIGGSGFEDNVSVRSRFGEIGFADADTQQFSGEAARALSSVIANTFAAAAQQMTQEQIAGVADKLAQTVFDGLEGEFTTQDFLARYGPKVLPQALGPVFDALDSRLGTLIRAFSGTTEEIISYAGDLLRVNALLRQGGLFGGLDPQDVLDLADAFGTLDSLLSETSFFLDKFYTEEEKTARIQNELSQSFSALGLSVPQTREAFRELVEAQDLSTEAGQRMYRALIALAPAMDSVLPAFDALIDAADQFVGSISAAASAIAARGEVDAFIDPILAMLDGIPEVGDRLRAQSGFLASVYQQVNADTTIPHSERLGRLGRIWQVWSEIDNQLATFNTLAAQFGDTVASRLLPAALDFQKLTALFANFPGELALINANWDRQVREALAESSAGSGLREWLNGLLVGAFSTLSPRERVNEAMRQFNEAIAAGTGIREAGDALLQVGREVFGTAPQYNAIFSEVLSRAGVFASLEDGGPVTAGQIDDVLSIILQIKAAIDAGAALTVAAITAAQLDSNAANVMALASTGRE